MFVKSGGNHVIAKICSKQHVLKEYPCAQFQKVVKMFINK